MPLKLSETAMPLKFSETALPLELLETAMYTVELLETSFPHESLESISDLAKKNCNQFISGEDEEIRKAIVDVFRDGIVEETTNLLSEYLNCVLALMGNDNIPQTDKTRIKLILTCLDTDKIKRPFIIE